MSCSIFSPVAYHDSKWGAAWLPIRYTLNTSKWPVNSFDGEDSVTAIVNNGGFARVTLSSASVIYVAMEWIKISGSSVSAYDGVWQIKTIHSATDITISAAYTATATATMQRYYNNYVVNVRVYVGIPDTHTLTAENPMALRGTLSYRPNKSNDVVANISSYVRADLAPAENFLCEILQAGDIVGNDYHLWTAFYIEWSESYDQSDGIEISTFTSGWQADVSEDGYSINYLYAAYATNQFQYFQGRSMGEYAVQDVILEDAIAKFMTNFPKPVHFEGYEFDLAIILVYENIANTVQYAVEEFDSFGASLGTTTTAVTSQDSGIYRFALSEFTFNASTAEFDFYIRDNSGTTLSEVLRCELNRTDCGKNPVYLRWFNHLGGWDSWLFPADNDYAFDVADRDITRRDVFSDWDNVFSHTGDTEDDYVRTEAYERRTVRSQFLSQGEKETMKWLHASAKVQEVYLANDSFCGNFRKRTVLLDSGTFAFRQDADKLKIVAFSFRYTNPIRVQGQ